MTAEPLFDDWRNHGACRTEPAESWFVDDPTRRAYSRAKEICHTCQVRVQCLDYAMREETGRSAFTRYGIFGGLDPRERADADPTRQSSNQPSTERT